MPMLKGTSLNSTWAIVSIVRNKPIFGLVQTDERFYSVLWVQNHLVLENDWQCICEIQHKREKTLKVTPFHIVKSFPNPLVPSDRKQLFLSPLGQRGNQQRIVWK